MGSRRVTLLTFALLAATAGSASANEGPTPWRFQEIDAAQRTVRIGSSAGGCKTPLPATVEETATSVRITERIAFPDPSEQRSCIADFRFVSEQVQLARPLAGRKLLGAATGADTSPAGRPSRAWSA